MQFNPEDFPDSRYARELQRGFRALRFTPEVEREFLELYLGRLSFRMRLMFLLGMLTAAAFLTRSLTDPGVTASEPWLHASALAAHAVMLLLAFTPRFRPHYLRVGSLVVPVISVVCTVLSVLQVARGRFDLLMSITTLPILFYFLAGLRFRSALTSALLSVPVFVGTAMYSGLAPALWYPCTAVLGALVIICALVAWDAEYIHRQNFVESRLLRELAALDGLTGVKNRRAFDEHLTRVSQHALREQGSFALMLIDCDHFKRYNDAYGHQAGDEALRRVARIVDRFARRPFDFAARYGGEEFALVLYRVPEAIARRIAGELRAAVEEARIEHTRSLTRPVMTVSVGVALISPVPSIDARVEAVQLADQALYTAKRSGRNCVSLLQRLGPSDHRRGMARQPNCSAH
jgi:diguanylate cyclase (GGDEF)-like protein